MSKTVDPRIEENLRIFHQASAEMAAKLIPDSKQGIRGRMRNRLRKSLTFNPKYWQKKISPEHLGLIHKNISDNRQSIDNDILQSPDLAAFYKHNEEKKIYLSFEIVATKERVYIFYMSKSNLANFNSIKRLKEKPLTEEEVKAGKNRSKEIDKGNFKIVQYCLYWTPGMSEPETFTCAVMKGKKAIDSLGPELKFGSMIGEPFTNVGIKGVMRKNKNGRQVMNFYSRLALSDQYSWVKGEKNMTPPAKMNPNHFMLVLYTQALGLEHLFFKDIIWRDLKAENYLMVLTAIKIVRPTRKNKDKNKKEIQAQLPLPKMIDWGLSAHTSDLKKLKNDGGSFPYMSPWHDFYLKLREARINFLIHQDEQQKALDELEKLKKKLSPSDPRLIKLEEDYNLYKSQCESFQKIFASKEREILEKYRYCKNAIDAIKNYNLTDFYSSQGSTTFLLSYRDDSWAFSKLMIQYIEDVWISDSLPKDFALGDLYQYFYENMHASWNTIPNGAHIVQEMEKIFKKYFPDSNSELQLLIQGVKKYFSEQNYREYYAAEEVLMKYLMTDVNSIIKDYLMSDPDNNYRLFKQESTCSSVTAITNSRENYFKN